MEKPSGIVVHDTRLKIENDLNSLSDSARNKIITKLKPNNPEGNNKVFWSDRNQEVIKRLELTDLEKAFYTDGDINFLKNNNIHSRPGEVNGFFHPSLDLAFIRLTEISPVHLKALINEMIATHEVAHSNEKLSNIIFKEFYCVNRESDYVLEIANDLKLRRPEEDEVLSNLHEPNLNKITDQIPGRMLTAREAYQIFGPFMFGAPKIDPDLGNVRMYHSSNSYAIMNMIQFLTGKDLTGFVRKNGSKDGLEKVLWAFLQKWDFEIASLMKKFDSYDEKSTGSLHKVFLRMFEKHKKELLEKARSGEYPAPRPGGCGQAIVIIQEQGIDEIVETELKAKKKAKTIKYNFGNLDTERARRRNSQDSRNRLRGS